MRKIRILTFWNVPNYGAFLQAYALQTYIQNSYPQYDVKQISHLHKRHYNQYYSLLFFGDYKFRFINPNFYKAINNVRERKIEIKRLRKFIDYYKLIPSESYSSKSQKLDCLDVLVLGSDIIWDYSLDLLGHDKLLFGDGIYARKKISYAPSFGTVKKNQDVPDYVKKSLENMDGISVRDSNSKKIADSITGGDAQIVLDPTFLWDFNHDEKIPMPEYEDYIVVYGGSFTEKLINGAQKYCKENNLKLICLNSLDDNFEWCDIVLNQDDLTPFEWLSFFKYSKAIMTCTYHGLVFGLIFQKPIVFNMTDFIMSKSKSLIQSLHLWDVLVNFDEFEKKITWDWDYRKINKNLEVQKELSKSYLNAQLDE